MKNSAKLTLDYSQLIEKFAIAESLNYFVSNIDKSITIYFDSIFQMTLKMEALIEAQERGFVIAWDGFEETTVTIALSIQYTIPAFKEWVREANEEKYKKYLSEIED